MKQIPTEDGREPALTPCAGGRPGDTGGAVRPRGALFWAAALLVVALAIVLRFLFISRYEVWLDEAYCFSVAAKPIRAIISDLTLDNGPPLYYILLHYWMALFGDGPAALRSLSALFSAATVALVVFWRTPWLGRASRLAAGFMLAITPLALYYAQEARMYSPVVFFAVAGAIFLERGLREGGRANWLLFALFTVLGLYTSYVAFFLVPLGYLTIAIGCVFDRDTAKALRRLAGLVAAHALAAAAFLPWLPVFFAQPRAAATQWIERNVGRPHVVVTPLRSLSVMSVGGGYYPRYLRQLYLDPLRVDRTRTAIEAGREKNPALKVLTRIPPLAALSVMVLLTVHLFWTALSSRRGRFPHRSFLLLWLALPILFPLLLSLSTPVYVVGRYELTGLPAFALVSGLGISALGKRARAAAPVIAAALFFYSWGYMELFPTSGPAPARGRYVAQITAGGDVVLAAGFEYAPLHYHIGDKRREVRFITFPRGTKHHSAWIDYGKWLEGSPGFERPRASLYAEAAGAIEEAIGATAPGGKIVVVTPPAPPRWEIAMEEALSAALADAARAGIEPVAELSSVRSGIAVYRKLTTSVPATSGP